MKTGNSQGRILTAGLSALALLGADAALAGSATVESADGERVVFEYADGDKLRMNTSSEDTWIVVRDNTLYSVVYDNGEPMVVNASTMMKGFADMAKMTEQAAPSGTTGELVSIRATGRSETVAGISGEVHEITTREEGREVTRDVVLSSDERALEFRDALYTMVRATTASMDEEVVKNSSDFHDRLGDMNVGILRYGTDMRVAAIDGDTVAASRFELPAEPMDMSGLGGMMGAFGAGARQDGAAAGGAQGAGNGGGLFSGMMNRLGGGRDGAAEAEAGDESEAETGEETEKEASPGEDAGKAVGRAFRKLFGD